MTCQSQLLIQESMNSIIERITVTNTRDKALEEYGCLLSKTTSSMLVSALSNSITNVNVSNKEILILLPLMFTSDSNLNLKCLNDILTLVNNSIIISNVSIFHFISKIFGQIVLLLHQGKPPQEIISNSHKALYSFCLNIVNERYQKAKGLGFLCLTELIDNSPIVKETAYIGLFWNAIRTFLDYADFDYKLEVMNCLLSLIYSSEDNFHLYANEALYQIIDYLNDSDWLKKKLSLNVIYLLIHFCFQEIIPLKEDIREFLHMLKQDSIYEVREVCLQTIELFEEKCSIMKVIQKPPSIDKTLALKNHKSYSENVDIGNIFCKSKENLIDGKPLLNNDNFRNNNKLIQQRKKEKLNAKINKKTIKQSYSTFTDRNNQKQYQQYTTNDIHLILTNKLIIKNIQGKKDQRDDSLSFSSNSSFNTRFQKSKIHIQKNKSDLDLTSHKRNYQISRNNQSALTQRKIYQTSINDNIDYNDKINLTQRELTIYENNHSNTFERLYNSSIGNPRRKQDDHLNKKTNGNKVIVVNKILNHSKNNDRGVESMSNLTQRTINQEKKKDFPKSRLVIRESNSSRLGNYQSQNQSHIKSQINSLKPHFALETDANVIIIDLINQINQMNTKKSNNYIEFTEKRDSLSVNISQLNTFLSSLDESSKAIFFLQNQSSIHRLIKLLIDLNDYDKAIIIMLYDNNLLLKSLSIIKRQKYTKIPGKSLESLIAKVINIIPLSQEIEKILDLILIVLNDKLSISNEIKKNILKSMEYLLSNAKDITLNEHCYTNIRLIIKHSSNK